MACLQSDNITFEFRFKEFDDCFFIQYEISFLWNGQPMFNDDILKKSNQFWANRNHGAFKAWDHREDIFIATLEKVLQTNKADYWHPAEPGVTIAIYPDRLFPFTDKKDDFAWETETQRKERLEREERKAAAGGKLPDDCITVIVLIDQYNLENSELYNGDGPALIISPKRHQVERFCCELKKEYRIFKERFQVDKKNEENLRR